MDVVMLKSCHSCHSPDRVIAGFSLFEALVAVALALLVIGAVVPLVTTHSVVAATTPEMIDEQQRARAGADAMSRDLLAAGAGMSVGPRAGGLIRFFAPVVPRKLGLTGSDAYNVARSDALTVVYVPETHAQSVLLLPMSSPSDSLYVDSSVGCPQWTQVCGLQAGDTALVFDEAGRFDLVGILSLQTNSASLEFRQPGIPSVSYASGAGVAAAESHTYYFDPQNLQLRHSDGAHSDVPVIDNVVSLSFEYFGDPSPPVLPRPPAGTANCLYDATGASLGAMATLSGSTSTVPLPLAMFTDGPWCGAGSNRFDADLLRVRTVRMTLRVQVGNSMMRGTSPDFVVAGRYRGSARAIPDYTIRMDISPRNLGAGRAQ